MSLGLSFPRSFAMRFTHLTLMLISLIALSGCITTEVINAAVEGAPDAEVVVDVTVSKANPEVDERINLAASIQELNGARVQQYEWQIVKAPATNYWMGSYWDFTTQAQFRVPGLYELSFRVIYKDRLDNRYTLNTYVQIEVMETSNG
jgi:hypothetical protein